MWSTALDLKVAREATPGDKGDRSFNKLSLKNQVDALLSRLRAFQDGKGGRKLPELQQSYDLLMMKVLSLRQDNDAPLTQDVVTSREAIWSVLADPAKFATLS